MMVCEADGEPGEGELPFEVERGVCPPKEGTAHVTSHTPAVALKEVFKDDTVTLIN